MMNQKMVAGILRKQMPYLKSAYGVKRIALFGSFATGKQKKGSDIDMVVTFAKPLGLKFIELAEYLEKALGRKIDILTPEGVKGIRIKKVSRDIIRNLHYV
ncbi:MAG: nucleotidyltransferase family protein [Candidatus Omnitrophota bacterium]